jgi:hypothetical protein
MSLLAGTGTARFGFIRVIRIPPSVAASREKATFSRPRMRSLLPQNSRTTA